jgi:hypothetical protein
MTRKKKPELPKTPAALLGGTSGIIPQGADPVPPRDEIGLPGNKRKEMDRQMQALRLQQAMQALHFTACDQGEETEKRIVAARELAEAMNRHFETIIWALRVAGGARRP